MVAHPVPSIITHFLCGICLLLVQLRFSSGCLCVSYKDVSTSPTVFESPVLPKDTCCRATIGNGYLGTVVYTDTVYMNGVYNGRLGDSHRARIPSTAAIEIKLASKAASQNETYKLDVERGTFHHIIETSEATIEQRLYAHQYLTRLLVSEVAITRKNGGSTPVSVTLRNNGGEKSQDLNYTVVPPVANGVWLGFGNTKVSETNTSSTITVFSYWTDLPGKITLPAIARQNTWYFFTSISDDKHDALNMFSIGQRLAEQGVLYEYHANAWELKWLSGRIDVAGNLKLSKAIYGSMYYILSSLPPLGAQHAFPFKFYGLSPGSLAYGALGQDYQGHVFWDQETWMYPPMLVFHPELALAMLTSRTMHLAGAKQNAAKYGASGARFPWEAAHTGVDVCPAVPESKDEIHISGDIAFAIQQYLYATNDTDFLKNRGGFDLVMGIGEFWAGRVQYSNSLHAYTVFDVMPPDEEHDMVNSSVYTNTIAQISLRLPAYAASLINQSIPDNWTLIADQMYVLYDQDHDYHPEFEGYKIGTIVKQADTILLGFPLMTPMNASTRSNDLSYYQNATDPAGPAMTWGMFAVGWLELGNEAKAEQLFTKSYAIHIQEPFKIWTESALGFGAINFITGMGSFLQAVVFGYGGLRLQKDALTVNLTLPPDTTELALTGVDYLGNSLNISGNATTLSVEVILQGVRAVDLDLTVGKDVYRLDIGKLVQVERQSVKITARSKTRCRKNPRFCKK